ncbi:hypothetical protein MTR67_019831 [Solanum verrucosum]|uniref:Uncharacterized protein n=1 Tax=Solanum verrucosum TaxID=315347 RepID=A0AAF0QNB7_SOLVR|nr:hypothetical protein MTR67_019831 [Solanum verrucosum]
MMKDGILSKNRRNEDRDLDNRKHQIDVKIVPGKEKQMKDGILALKEAIFQSEVEILENIGAEVGRGSSSNPFVPLVEHCLNLNLCIKLDATIIDSWYRKGVLNLLMTPYNEEEYKKLRKDTRRRLPSCSTNGHGKSLLSLHKGRLIACGLFSTSWHLFAF